MAKGPHNEAQRIELPNGMWMLIYESGDDRGRQNMKVSGYDCKIEVTELASREGGANLFFSVTKTSDSPRRIQPRTSDLVCVPRGTWEAIQRAK